MGPSHAYVLPVLPLSDACDSESEGQEIEKSGEKATHLKLANSVFAAAYCLTKCTAAQCAERFFSGKFYFL